VKRDRVPHDAQVVTRDAGPARELAGGVRPVDLKAVAIAGDALDEPMS